MSNDGKPRADLAFAAFLRIETKLDLLYTMLSGSGYRAVSDAYDAQSQHGDVKIKFAPKAWQGQSYKGSTASQCPAAFLSLYADALEQMAMRTMSKNDTKDDPEKLRYVSFDLRDAARARRWAIINKDKPAEVPQRSASDDPGWGRNDNDPPADW